MSTITLGGTITLAPPSTAPAVPPPSPSPGSLTSSPPAPASAAQFGDNWYREGSIDGSYQWDYGIRQMDVAGPPGTPAQLIRVHSGHCYRMVRWTAVCVGDLPAIPSPNTNNPNEVLAFAEVRPLTPIMAPDGTRVYRTSGTYIYFQVSTPTLGLDRLSAGTTPWDQQPSALNDIGPGKFDPRLLDSSSAIPSGGNIPSIKDILGS